MIKLCRKSLFLILLPILGSITFIYAQTSKHTFGKGFDAIECDEIMTLNTGFNKQDFDINTINPSVDGYKLNYVSAAIGLDNKWAMWLRSDSTVVILLRGTTRDMKSILADFYCSMFPAEGTIQISENNSFDYKLAEHEKAAVHGGFLIGFAFLAKDIKPKLDSLYQAGYHKYIVGGHSQGGALCYYVSAWLKYLGKTSQYNKIDVKTYASAPPKVGNSYFSYDYDHIMRSEWAFSITNSSDPVPELPFTIQQVGADVNTPNPIYMLRDKMSDAPFFKRIFLKMAFNRMEKRAIKSSKAYQKYLGSFVGNLVLDSTPGLQLSKPINTTYFNRPGVPISLLADEAYRRFLQDRNKPNNHHDIDSYRFLLRQQYKGLPDLD